MRISSFLLFTFFCQLILAEAQGPGNSAIASYVERYADISMELMRTTGVPASIKLAQGILESNSGRSTLAVEANNHFGIKCGSSWTGKTYYRKDDDRDKNGKLRPSCFRVFAHSEESFQKHSDFLTDPKKKYRYGYLFDLDPMDYKAWARGLKKAGYATNPKYAPLLIKIIEDHQLYVYDRRAMDKSMTEIIASSSVQESEEKLQEFKTRRINGVQAIRYDGKTPIEDIAHNLGLEENALRSFNDWDKEPAKSEMIFIQKKPLTYSGAQKKHVFSGRESIQDVAQRYGIQAEAIATLMNSQVKNIPDRGKKLKFKKLNRYFSASSNNRPQNSGGEEFLFEVKMTEERTPNGTTKRVKQHKVQAGETLFSISRLYGLQVNELVQMNNLENKELKPGMILKLTD